jgi:hypothetical protein
MGPVLPWLVAIEEREPLLPIWKTEGAGKPWGILCETMMEFDALRRHLRHFTTAMLPDGRVVMFRYYDPRVFQPLMEALSLGELQRWFNGIESFAFEFPAGVHHRYRLRDGKLFDQDRSVAVHD